MHAWIRVDGVLWVRKLVEVRRSIPEKRWFQVSSLLGRKEGQGLLTAELVSLLTSSKTPQWCASSSMPSPVATVESTSKQMQSMVASLRQRRLSMSWRRGKL